MTKKELKLIATGYGLDNNFNTKEVAEKRKKDHHSNGFYSQCVRRKVNGQLFWFVYVKK